MAVKGQAEVRMHRKVMVAGIVCALNLVGWARVWAGAAQAQGPIRVALPGRDWALEVRMHRKVMVAGIVCALNLVGWARVWAGAAQAQGPIRVALPGRDWALEL